MNKKLFFVILAVVIISIPAGFYFWRVKREVPIACTLEAKLCPDGSSVGRVVPNCEFAPCPPPSADASWKIFNDPVSGVSFRYPENPAPKYSSVVDWPPKIQIINQPFSCLNAGDETAPAGKTEPRKVDGRTYCLTRESEGAAGSIYTLYAYAFPLGEKTAIFTFSLRYSQCGNYPEAEKKECENLRQAFDLDSLVDKMALSMKISDLR